MTTIVTGNCHRSRFTECVAVCPEGAFRGGKEMSFIDPDVCTDCGDCIPVCPVHAIYEVKNLPEELHEWIEINARRSKKLPKITSKEPPYPGAEERKRALGFEPEEASL